MTFPPLRHAGVTVLLLALGAACGLLLARLGAPLPYMLGSLIASAAVVVGFGTRLPENYLFPNGLRDVFIGVIGIMIGAQVSPTLVALLPTMALSVPAVLVFVVAAHGANYLIFRRIGGLDRSTSYFSGSPGGLLESITFGEEAGADIRQLTILQFLRIIVVVSLVPVGISLYEGAPVGSAAGLAVSAAPVSLADIALAIALALVGGWGATRLRLPAAGLTGPLILVGAASGLGLLTLTLPPWLVAMAQVVLGAGLGIRFSGLTGRMLLGGLGLSLLSGAAMLAIGGLLALFVAQFADFDMETLIISFAPGGVTEMSLIALSLAANPAFVTLHHLVRIIATVVELTVVRKTGWLER